MSDATAGATAHEAWDRRWRTVEGRADWLDPEPEVRDIVPALREKGVRRVLDLGCGVGRHALFLAGQGFAVTALDASEAGLAYLRGQAGDSALDLDLRTGRMTDLPFADGTFDHVLSWNVIYHGDAGVVRRVLAEVDRVLSPGSAFQATMLSKRHHRFAQGREIAPGTWVIDEDDEKSHPHFYCDALGLVTLFQERLEVVELGHREQGRPGTWHWHVVAEKR